MTANDLRARAMLAASLDEKITKLQEDKHTAVQELERRAYVIAHTQGGIIRRTTEHLVFDGISSRDPNLATFNTYDGYDGEWTTACSFTFDQLADFENTAAILADKKRQDGLRQAEEDLKRVQKRVERLGDNS